MKQLIIALVLLVMPKTRLHTHYQDKPPAFLLGYFTDDYGSTYKISDTLWQQGSAKYNIIKWNTTEQYLIAKNDSNNPGGKNLYTRIDYMEFKNMEPWRWGYCYTAYNAPTDAAAEATAAADKENPKKGCGGYPFSRMMAAKK